MSDALDALIDEHLNAPADPLDALIDEHLGAAAPVKPNLDIGPLATGAVHGARHLSFGLGDKVIAGIHALNDYAHDKTGKVTLADAYKRDLAFNDKVMDASDEANPKARWAGNVAGVAGSLVAPLGVAKLARTGLLGAKTAAAANAAASAAPAAAQGLRQLVRAAASQGAKTGAVMGALGGFGNSRADGVGGQFEDTALGAGTGLVGGAALGAAAPALAGAAAKRLTRFSNSMAARAVRGTAGEYKKLGEEGVQEVGDWLNRNKAVRFGDSMESIAPRVDELRSKAGEAMSKALSEAESQGVRIDPGEYERRLLDAAIQAEKYGPAAKPRVDQLLNAAEEASSAGRRLGRPLTPAESELWKQGYQDVAYPKGLKPLNPTPAQATDMDIARHAKEVTEQALEQGLAGKPSADAYRAAKGDYGAAVTLNRMLGGAEGRALARHMASPTDKAFFVAHLAMGNPLAAAATAGANHFIGPRILSSLAATSRLGGAFARYAGEDASPLLSRAAADPRMAALIEALRGRSAGASPVSTPMLAQQEDSP